jgi:type III secretory pathway component EscS
MIGLVYVGGGVLAAAVVGLAVGLLRSLRNG